MTDPDVNCKTDKANEILELYRELESTNLRKLSHMDFSILDIDEKRRALLQIEFDTNKQKKMFSDIVGESKEYVTDVLVKLLQDDVNKDTLWRLFGDVIYENIKRNLNGTKLCKCCGKRYIAKEKDYSSTTCSNCKTRIEKENTKKRVKKFRENKQIS